MIFARLCWPLLAAAVLAACSGNLGGGQSTLPGTPQSASNVQQIAPPLATATPSSASNVATIGDNPAPQALPNILGWGGTIVFPKPAPVASASSNPKATAADAPTPAAVSIGVTDGVVEPADAPPLDPSAKRRGKRDSGGLTPLLFVSLMSTADVTLSAYPRIAFDVPRDIAAKHRNDTFALALYDPENKDKGFRLAVAERDLSSPLPASFASPVATPIPTPIPNGPIALTPPPVSSNQASSLPPEQIVFAATPATLLLKSDRPVVFALYAVPPPQASPSPKASAPNKGGPSPTPSAPGSVPAASPSPTASANPNPNPSSAASAGPSPTASAPAGASPLPTAGSRNP